MCKILFFIQIIIDDNFLGKRDNIRIIEDERENWFYYLLIGFGNVFKRLFSCTLHTRNARQSVLLRFFRSYKTKACALWKIPAILDSTL